jgi:hypothetical protein
MTHRFLLRTALLQNLDTFIYCHPWRQRMEPLRPQMKGADAVGHRRP